MSRAACLTAEFAAFAAAIDDLARVGGVGLLLIDGEALARSAGSGVYGFISLSEAEICRLE